MNINTITSLAINPGHYNRFLNHHFSNTLYLLALDRLVFELFEYTTVLNLFVVVDELLTARCVDAVKVGVNY